ncbi:hypothetical protein [Spiroplasma taiwanense]|uniref:Uncharacterized protein n=1 Tax=Spiroplasma taiwanense CT-1 TaxID=1276220 RepID=S5LY67_9MOLU|nr:hypothetical protein [Spiroplasma taiwanense]AGR41536.1 hypothetical protein STAIW_v1c09500 [Spiroplasma taiwanense CT-1]
MKKVLFSLTATSLTLAAFTPIVNRQNRIDPPFTTIEKRFSYSYNFNNLDFNSCNWNINAEGLKSCTLSTPEFSHGLEDMIKEIYQFVIAEKFATNQYKVLSIYTNFNNRSDSLRNELDNFNELLYINTPTNTNIDQVKVTNQSVTFERTYDPYFGDKFYVKNVIAEIENHETNISKKINLYGIPSYHVFKSVDELKTNFINHFNFELTLVIDLTYIDDIFKSEIILPNEVYFQAPIQIINWFEKNENKQREKVLEYINKELSISLKKIDKISKFYKAEYDFNSNQFVPVGNNIGDSREFYEDPYFFIGVTSEDESIGEFKMLIKNLKN